MEVHVTKHHRYNVHSSSFDIRPVAVNRQGEGCRIDPSFLCNRPRGQLGLIIDLGPMRANGSKVTNRIEWLSLHRIRRLRGKSRSADAVEALSS